MIFSEPIVITKFAPGAEPNVGHFEGVASSWSMDRHGDIVARGAYAQSIAALHAGSMRVPLLANHKTDRQIGGIKTAEETDDGLVVTGVIVRGTPDADRAYELAKANQVSLSVGFIPVANHVEKIAGAGSRFTRVDLTEISAVAVASNRESRVLHIKELAEISPAELARVLRDGDLPPLPRRLAEKFAKACFGIEDDDEGSEVAALLNAARDRIKNSFNL